MRYILTMVLALCLLGCGSAAPQAAPCSDVCPKCGCSQAAHKSFFNRMPCTCGAECPRFCTCDF